MMPRLRRLLVPLMLLMTVMVTNAFAAVPDFPPGKDFSTPKPMKKPGSAVARLWRAVVARQDLPLYKSFTGDELLAKETGKFGDLVFIVDVYEVKDSPRRVLLGKFDDKGAKFQSWLGWADPDYLVSDIRPMKVKEAREQLVATVGKNHPFHDRIQESLPDASRQEFGNVTLKAVTHPERGRACFSQPVSPDNYDAASKSEDAIPLQPFAFVYVYKVVVEPKNVYCLIGPRSEIALEAGEIGDKFRKHLTGWVQIENLVLWTTREAFEYNLEKGPLESRRTTKTPIDLFAKKQDLQDWAVWEREGRKGPSPVRPVHSEELDSSKAPEWMQRPWDPLWMRYPILSSYLLTDDSGKDAWLGYQICILGATKSGGSAADLEAMKKQLNDAVKEMRVFELVIVLDTTASMGTVFEPLKNSVVEMVDKLKARAASEKDELEKIQLRVAIVQYKDFENQESSFLTRSSKDFYDVMTPAGLAEFREAMAQVKESGGGDQLEEPFEGIDEAVKKFLGLEGTLHSSGAARVIMVIGDSGNHEKEQGDTKVSTRLTFEDVLAGLNPVGKDVVGKQRKDLAKIQLHSVMCFLNEEDPKKEREGLKKWDEQIHELARKSGGTVHEVGFYDETVRKSATQGMVDALTSALDARRALMQNELTAIRNGFGGGEGESGYARAASMVIAKDRLKEVLKGENEVDRLVKGLSQAFFTEVHTVEQYPNEPEGLARLKLCVLMSEKEFVKILAATQLLAEGLEGEVDKVVAGGSGEKLEARIKELVIRTMLAAFGDDATPARLAELKSKTADEIQDEINQLPIKFGILKKFPEDEDELRKMIQTLKAKASRLHDINGPDRPKRFFPAGVATGESHVWLHREVLP